MSQPKSMTEEVIVLFSTVGGEEQAVQIAHALIDRRLAACVNVVPQLTSVYRWQNKVHEEKEALLIIKTRRSLFEKIEAAFTELHPYEVPELISWTLAKGHAPYLKWVNEETKEK